MARRRYTAGFKREAARIIIIDGTPVKRAFQQPGVPEGVFYKWRRKHPVELGASNPEDSASPKKLAAESERLRKEPAKSRRMNEI